MVCILYSLGIDVCGQLMEVFSGMALGAYLQKYVFYPLGMHDTGFFVPEHHLLRLRRSCIIKPAIGCCTRWIKREKIAYGVRNAPLSQEAVGWYLACATMTVLQRCSSVKVRQQMAVCVLKKPMKSWSAITLSITQIPMI